MTMMLCFTRCNYARVAFAGFAMFAFGTGCSSAGTATLDESRARRTFPGIDAEANLFQDVEDDPESTSEFESETSRSALTPEAPTSYAGVVALSNCSGSFVRFTTSKGTDRGMVLTNGHCYERGLIAAGTAVANVASSRRFRLLSPSGTGNVGRVTASRVLYGTMTTTDMLLYELTETYDRIASRLSTTPLTIADKRPEAGERISIPSGYWRRTYSCAIDTFIPKLLEGTWTFRDSIKYSEPGCEVIGGTSGSPIVRAETREVIGINNTGNMDGERCTIDNPCEVDDAGNVVVDQGGSYGQELYLVYACITARNTFDLTLPGCTLTRPR
jgi:V8-like Glu-specific endopeptidase